MKVVSYEFLKVEKAKELSKFQKVIASIFNIPIEVLYDYVVIVEFNIHFNINDLLKDNEGYKWIVIDVERYNKGRVVIKNIEPIPRRQFVDFPIDFTLIG